MILWNIEDYAVLYLLHINGFACVKQPGRPGISWYLTDLPIEDNGRYELPGGFAIKAIGAIELRATKKEQGER